MNKSKKLPYFLDTLSQTIIAFNAQAFVLKLFMKTFNIEEFMWIVKIKIKSSSPSVREFLIKWITTSNEVITVDLLTYLP